MKEQYATTTEVLKSDLETLPCPLRKAAVASLIESHNMLVKCELKGSETCPRRISFGGGGVCGVYWVHGQMYLKE